jgi:hypothetical protein
MVIRIICGAIMSPIPATAADYLPGITVFKE